MRSALLRLIQRRLDELCQQKKDWVGSWTKPKKMRRKLSYPVDELLMVQGWIEQGKTYDEAMEAHTALYHLHAFSKPITELLGRK